MTRPQRMSVVLPVRDSQDQITARVQAVIELLDELTSDPGAIEVLVVDDGSRDETAHILDEMMTSNPSVRLIRHSRPRGLEAAGQTGLERATGNLVFIQEQDSDIRAEDLKRLFQMSQDKTILAARAQSKPKSISRELIRRLKAWGTNADEKLQEDEAIVSSLQMIRKTQLQRLSGPRGDGIRLNTETIHTESQSSV